MSYASRIPLLSIYPRRVQLRANTQERVHRCSLLQTQHQEKPKWSQGKMIDSMAPWSIYRVGHWAILSWRVICWMFKYVCRHAHDTAHVAIRRQPWLSALSTRLCWERDYHSHCFLSAIRPGDQIYRITKTSVVTQNSELLNLKLDPQNSKINPILLAVGPQARNFKSTCLCLSCCHMATINSTHARAKTKHLRCLANCLVDGYALNTGLRVL